MFTNDKIRYIDLFLFLYSNPWANTKKIMKPLNKTYSNTLKILGKLYIKEYLERRKKTGEIGGAEWEYKLSDSIIEFLGDLSSLFQDTLQLNDNVQIKKMVKTFLQAYPSIIKKSNLQINDNKMTVLKDNIKSYFKDQYGIE